MKKKLVAIFVLLLVLIEFLMIFLMYKSVDNKNTLKIGNNGDSSINDIVFNIYVFNNNEYMKQAKVPDIDYVLNLETSYCVDKDNKRLENAISYTDGNVEINNLQSNICYLYFDKK